MVGVVDDLEAHRLVRRSRHPDDRRAHAVHLTGRARTVLNKADIIAHELEETVLSPLDDAERAQFIALLQRVAAHAGLPSGVHPGLHRRLPRLPG